jgi:hypothetical protein
MNLTKPLNAIYKNRCGGIHPATGKSCGGFITNTSHLRDVHGYTIQIKRILDLYNSGWTGPVRLIVSKTIQFIEKIRIKYWSTMHGKSKARPTRGNPYWLIDIWIWINNEDVSTGELLGVVYENEYFDAFMNEFRSNKCQQYAVLERWDWKQKERGRNYS